MIWGVDASFDFNFSSQLNLDLNASYTRAQDLKNELPIINIPPFNSTQTIKYSSHKNRYDVEVVNHFVARQKRFPDLNFSVKTLS